MPLISITYDWDNLGHFKSDAKFLAPQISAYNCLGGVVDPKERTLYLFDYLFFIDNRKYFSIKALEKLVFAAKKRY